MATLKHLFPHLDVLDTVHGFCSQMLVSEASERCERRADPRDAALRAMYNKCFREVSAQIK